MQYEFIPASENDQDWLFALHKKTLGPHIEQASGWDDSAQLRSFKERSTTYKDSIIYMKEKPIGMLSLQEDEQRIYLARIEITPECQRKGVGGEIIQSILDRARENRKAVELRVLKNNPAKRLYDRLGFIVTEETDTHYRMKYNTRNSG